MADQAKKSLPKRTGNEKGKRMRARSHERRKARVEASQKAQERRARANREAGKPVRVRTRREPLGRHERHWHDAVAMVRSVAGVGVKY